MAKAKKDANKYGVEVITYHEVTINWHWIGDQGKDCDYRDQVFDRTDNHWLVIKGEFPGVEKMWEQSSMGHRYYPRFRLRGDNPATVLAAGKEMAKKIFSHRYVEPGIEVPAVSKFRTKLNSAGGEK
jgi:hypothetical protein